MGIANFVRMLFDNLNYVENKIQTGCKFSQSELNEILRTAKGENVKFLMKLSQINKLSAFDISFLLSSANLNEEKIDTIKQAALMYNEKEFAQVGQSFSDFIFRVGANLDMLNCDNLSVFKELVNCKNEVYDFTEIMKKPTKQRKKKNKEFAYAFEKVLVD